MSRTDKNRPYFWLKFNVSINIALPQAINEALHFKVEEDTDTPTSSQNLPSSGSLYLPSSASSYQTGVYILLHLSSYTRLRSR